MLKNLAVYKIGEVIKPPKPINFKFLLVAKSNEKLDKTLNKNIILLEVSKTLTSIFLFKILFINFLPIILVTNSILVLSFNLDNSLTAFIAGKI